jgi:hypothetical protein
VPCNYESGIAAVQPEVLRSVGLEAVNYAYKRSQGREVEVARREAEVLGNLISVGAPFGRST